MSFQAAQIDGHKVPRTVTRPVTGTFPKGSLVVLTAGVAGECGTDPALIAGVALSAVGAGSGALFPIGRQEFPPNVIQILAANNQQVFSCRYAGTLGTVGTDYGVTKNATTGLWEVDFAKTGAAARVKLLDIDSVASPPSPTPISGARILVSVLQANVQII